ncbi:hypothetical protein PAHAL_3G328500 [Panicum hallii]|jgi:hypothetical protein|uniref:Uncharacterized protein n=1 Tax=Panicum hallii TaxID=206008 RepID=A0A2T8KK68_9POAL|nr:hypothetical protein PAHAL_3G328500 [Panicum hallii]
MLPNKHPWENGLVASGEHCGCAGHPPEFDAQRRHRVERHAHRLRRPWGFGDLFKEAQYGFVGLACV